MAQSKTNEPEYEGVNDSPRKGGSTFVKDRNIGIHQIFLYGH